MLIFEIALIVIPLGLVSLAWRRYLMLTSTSTGRSLQVRMGLGLISLSVSMWLAVCIVMALGDNNQGARSIRENLSPGMLATINLLLLMGGFACSRAWRQSEQETVPLRRTIALSSGCLMFLWLLLASNPH